VRGKGSEPCSHKDCEFKSRLRHQHSCFLEGWNRKMILYQTKTSRLSGSSWKEVCPKARRLLHAIEKRTKRQPYIRSAYFKKEKIFINYFWPHLMQKPRRERLERLKILPCAIELIENSHRKPAITISPNKPKEKLYRFAGMTPNQELFFVQIKENKTRAKYFMSIFPSIWFKE